MHSNRKPFIQKAIQLVTKPLQTRPDNYPGIKLAPRFLIPHRVIAVAKVEDIYVRTP